MKSNYLSNTKALFTECRTPKREPDFVEGNSSYWEEKDFLYMESNEWSKFHSYKQPVFQQYQVSNCGSNQFGLWLHKPIKLSKDGKNKALRMFAQLLKGNYTLEEFGNKLKELNHSLYLNDMPLCGRVKWEDLICLD